MQRIHRVVWPVVLALGVFGVTGAAAQQGDIAEIILVDAIQGHRTPFEDGVKRHFEVARNQGADDAWFAWEIITGENTGKYYVGTFGHSWADFDEMPGDPAAMQASFEQNIRPHVEHAVPGFWRYREDLSRETGEMEGPTRFAQLYYYKAHLGGAEELEAVFRAVREAADNQGWSEEWEVYSLVNGGEHPLYVVAIGSDDFAGFAEPDPNMGQMLATELGQQGAGDLFRRFVEAVEWEKSETIAWRQDLSLIP